MTQKRKPLTQVFNELDQQHAKDNLRDLFAAAALHAIASTDTNCPWPLAAKQAYDAADAMLQARNPP